MEAYLTSPGKVNVGKKETFTPRELARSTQKSTSEADTAAKAAIE